MSLEFDLSIQNEMNQGKRLCIFNRAISHPFDNDNNVSEHFLTMQVSYSSYKFVPITCINTSDTSVTKKSVTYVAIRFLYNEFRTQPAHKTSTIIELALF